MWVWSKLSITCSIVILLDEPDSYTQIEKRYDNSICKDIIMILF